MKAGIRRRHRAATAALVSLLVAELTLVVFGGHRGQHMARDLLVPGAGTLDEHPTLGVTLLVAAIAATVLWLRWGAEWLMGAVVAVALTVTATVTAPHDAAGALPFVARAGAHEFPLVVLVAGMLSWVRSVLVRMPGVSRLAGALRRRRSNGSDIAALPPVDRCRAATLRTLAGAGSGVDRAALRHAVGLPDVARRARRIGLVARGRLGGDPFRRDHAPARTARLATGLDGDDAAVALADDAARSPLGLPSSEPGWVRPVDATLAALVLHRSGEPAALTALGAALDGPWRRRGGRRPAWAWTPAMVAAGTAAPWEQATVTALAHAAGVLAGSADLADLRRRMLGAAARHTGHPDDERLVAAARLWLAVAEDDELRRVVARRSPGTDPLAVSIDALAASVAAGTPLVRA